MGKVAEAAGLRQAVTVPDPHDLDSTLSEILPALRFAQHDWWILGSAAIALHGADPGEIRDIDVLLDRRDYEAVLGRLGVRPSPGNADALFRSALFNRWQGAGLAVEFFADFQVRDGAGWRTVQPATRVAVQRAGLACYVPELDELVAILRGFGREKDLARVAAISRTARFPSRSGNV